MVNRASECILIVEDDPTIHHFYEVVISREFPEFTIKSAYTGAEGLKLARLFKPDLVLLDIMLPQIDGFQVCKLITSEDETKNICVAIISAKDNQEDLDLGLANGAIKYLTKPFTPEGLIELIQKILRGKRLGLYSQ